MKRSANRPAAGLSALALLSGVCALVPGVAAHASIASSADPSSVSSPSGTAPGGPGRQSYLDTSRKDCFGTARNTVSKVWYTVADGVLSDVFSPTIENTNVSTLQFIVTDGATFSDLQQRNMTYTVSSPGPSGMVCQVTSTDQAHGFQLVTDYITDPARDSVVMHTRLVPLAGHRSSVSGLKVYVRYDATIDNTGGGGQTNAGANNATVDPATTALVSSDTKAPAGRLRPGSPQPSSPTGPSSPRRVASSVPRATVSNSSTPITGWPTPTVPPPTATWCRPRRFTRPRASRSR